MGVAMLVSADNRPKVPINGVKILRGPLGRWIPVPADAPSNIAEVGATTFSLSGLLDPVLESHREYKNKRYAAKKADPKYKGPRIVAEGDSWFEYPYNDDLIMILGEKYAIMSLAKAGDAWADLYRKSELFPAVVQEKPDIVMLSMGGNEIMGQIENFVHQFELDRTAAQYVLPSLDEMIKWIGAQYRTAIPPLLAQGAHVIVHGYDYPDPREAGEQGAQWVGPPLKNMRNIDGVTMWREIANVMIDRYNKMLRAMAARPEFAGFVHHVDLRNTIGSNDFVTGPDRNLWTDEIHGSAAGFAKLARKFDKVISKITAATA